jgi:Family of unknown function (DUF5906)
MSEDEYEGLTGTFAAACRRADAARRKPDMDSHITRLRRHEEPHRELANQPRHGPPATYPATVNTANKASVSLDDFYAYMPMHNYIFAPSRQPWPASSVNARLPPVPLFDANGRPVLDKAGAQKTTPANLWLDQNQPVEQMTWAPGLPMIIKDRLISDGGWIERKRVSCFNIYRPPIIAPGDPTQAGPWLEHAHKVFGDNAEHIVKWLAHRVQRPQDKINHALVLGGPQGIGKDTLLEPVKYAVGPWNFAEVSPTHMLGRFNGFLRSVILRVSEARDLGDTDRFQFYDHMKAYTAAPPDVLRVDEKNLREYSILNCCGVIITSNHSDGIYLPADDRRHFVAWSDLTKEDFALPLFGISSTPAALPRTPSSPTSSISSATPTPPPSFASQLTQRTSSAAGSATAKTAASFRTGLSDADTSPFAMTPRRTACGKSTVNDRPSTPRTASQSEIG